MLPMSFLYILVLHFIHFNLLFTKLSPVMIFKSYYIFTTFYQ